MIETLTVEEAYAIVEDALVESINELMLVRKRLERRKNINPRADIYGDVEYTRVTKKADLLRNINYYGAYIKGAKAMYLRLKEYGFLEIPKEKGCKKTTKEDRISNNALLDLYMKSTRNMEWLLCGTPLNIKTMVKFKRDGKGKVVGAEAIFYREEIKKVEV